LRSDSAGVYAFDFLSKHLLELPLLAGEPLWRSTCCAVVVRWCRVSSVELMVGVKAPRLRVGRKGSDGRLD
jgi:hypothetical protein